MEQTKKGTEMPSKQKSDISGGSRTTVRPEIDLPLKGGRADSEMAPKKPLESDRNVERGQTHTGEKTRR